MNVVGALRGQSSYSLAKTAVSSDEYGWVLVFADTEVIQIRRTDYPRRRNGIALWSAVAPLVSWEYSKVLGTITIVPDAMKFLSLVSQWRKERGATSSITEMAMCPSYQQIIAMGERVIPFILRELEDEGDEPDLWFWALQVLTENDPVSDEARGNMKKMADAWLDWARSRYAW